MLTFVSRSRRQRLCSDNHADSRRDFLRIGALAAGGLTLADVHRAAAESPSAVHTDRSVIWLWLGGGPTHVETFDPKMTAPQEYRSTTGEVKTSLPGVTLGGHFEKLAQQADKLAIVRSFAHTNSGHGGGTHYMMTGYDNRNIDNGGLPPRPSHGSYLARTRGVNHPRTGMPTYVRLNGISSDGPQFLGTAYSPFDPNGQARRNLTLVNGVDNTRLDNRRALLTGIDRLDRAVDRSGLMDGLDSFEQQAFGLITSETVKRAFDITQEDPRTIDRYGTGLGAQLLQARRLAEAGTGFVTIHYGGWDMHGNIKKAMAGRGPAVDHAVASLVEDLHLRGLRDNVMVVVTGEFGRTPKVNGNSGRDHWAPLTPLLLAGGGFNVGQVIGESSSKAERPMTDPIGPQHLMTTLFQFLGMDPNAQFVNQAGRPVYAVEDAHPIPGLI